MNSNGNFIHNKEKKLCKVRFRSVFIFVCLLYSNLLLPKGVPMDRQRATYQVIIFRAEDLPRTDLGIMASVRKAIGGAPVALVDACVKVSFAGHVVCHISFEFPCS